jgi:hypothetical protein
MNSKNRGNPLFQLIQRNSGDNLICFQILPGHHAIDDLIDSITASKIAFIMRDHQGQLLLTPVSAASRSMTSLVLFPSKAAVGSSARISLTDPDTVPPGSYTVG